VPTEVGASHSRIDAELVLDEKRAAECAEARIELPGSIMTSRQIHVIAAMHDDFSKYGDSL